MRNGERHRWGTRTIALLAWFALSATTAASSSAQSAAEDEDSEQQRLLEILRTAPPAPVVPAFRRFLPSESKAPAQRQVVGYDQLREVATVSPASSLDEAAPALDPPSAGMLPSAATGSPATVPAGTAFEGDPDGPFARATTPNPPTPVYNSLVSPYRTIVKLLMRFNVSGTDYYYVCSASLAGSFHLLTAGHCIYNWDPDGNGNTSDRRWADEVWAWAAQTDQVEPVGTPDRPYGEAKSVYLRSYTGWTQDMNYDHDWGVITLNRRDGDHTGWMGRETSPTTSLNFSGYPSQTPYVPANTLVQYFGFDANNVIIYTPTRILLDAYIYGGHSGGPSWRYDSGSGNRWIHGIHSTSDRQGYAEDTLLTTGKRNDLNAYMTDDESVRPPVARPDLIEYWFDLDAKDLLSNTVVQGQSFQVEYNLFNSGFAAAGSTTVDFYLSTNTTISTADTLIGSAAFADVAAFTFFNPIATLTAPAGQAPGTYYVGWIVNGSVSEYTAANNTVVISDETLTVQPAPTATRTRTGTATMTRTLTATRTATPSQTRTASLTPTWTRTFTATPSPTPTAADTATATYTASAGPTDTPTPAATATATPPPSATPTSTSAATATSTPLATETPPAPPVPTATPTATPSPPCADGAPIEKGLFKVSRNLDPSGDERLTVKGEAVLSPALDPLATGVSISVMSDGGALLYRYDVPAGAGLPGWSGHPGRWRYQDKLGTAAGGITKITVIDRSARTPGLYKFKLVGKGGHFQIPPAAAPVRLVVTLGPAPGQCAARAFNDAGGPSPACTLLGAGATVKCR